MVLVATTPTEAAFAVRAIAAVAAHRVIDIVSKPALAGPYLAAAVRGCPDEVVLDHSDPVVVATAIAVARAHNHAAWLREDHFR